ncbi:hypothetical protein HUG17_4404 [Dermatophagoides farinae]|uniref:Uncharacterized protein n=1 Tax=Dermatophagoides farinae TaxID=6954 RepID=A0A9D4P1J3_DERFA|nr:hypothetical protein HUG17_4404 [Dermatophagoides farinae]
MLFILFNLIVYLFIYHDPGNISTTFDDLYEYQPEQQQQQQQQQQLTINGKLTFSRHKSIISNLWLISVIIIIVLLAFCFKTTTTTTKTTKSLQRYNGSITNRLTLIRRNQWMDSSINQNITSNAGGVKDFDRHQNSGNDYMIRNQTLSDSTNNHRRESTITTTSSQHELSITTIANSNNDVINSVCTAATAMVEIVE